MREILFKAKRLDNGEWVEGFYFEFKGETYIAEMRQTFMTTYYTEESVVDFNMRAYEVEAETICQYTGLTDKNGNKIWENDIVKCYSFDCSGREVEFISDVFWDDCSWLLHEEEHCDGMLFYFDKNIKFESHVSEIEVIGNIFDNAELLEDSCTNSRTGN